jgi:hypothetical protein
VAIDSEQDFREALSRVGFAMDRSRLQGRWVYDFVLGHGVGGSHKSSLVYDPDRNVVVSGVLRPQRAPAGLSRAAVLDELEPDVRAAGGGDRVAVRVEANSEGYQPEIETPPDADPDRVVTFIEALLREHEEARFDP